MPQVAARPIHATAWALVALGVATLAIGAVDMSGHMEAADVSRGALPAWLGGLFVQWALVEPLGLCVLVLGTLIVKRIAAQVPRFDVLHGVMPGGGAALRLEMAEREARHKAQKAAAKAAELNAINERVAAAAERRRIREEEIARSKSQAAAEEAQRINKKLATGGKPRSSNWAEKIATSGGV